MYFVPGYSLLDSFTMATMQSVIIACFMWTVYPWFFRCNRARIRASHRIIAGFIAASFIYLTASRVPLPLAYLLFVPWGDRRPPDSQFEPGMSDRGARFMAFGIGLLVVIGTISLFFNAALDSNAGMLFWSDYITIDPTTNTRVASKAILLICNYSIAGAVFSIFCSILDYERIESMHTAQLVRDGTTIAIPILFLAWCFSFAPGLNSLSSNTFASSVMRFAIENRHVYTVEVVGSLFGSAFLQLCSLAATLECIKSGFSFTMGIKDIVGYIVILAELGTMPQGPSIGLVLGGAALMVVGAIGVQMVHMCAGCKEDCTCDACEREKRKCCGLLPKIRVETELDGNHSAILVDDTVGQLELTETHRNDEHQDII